MTPSCQCVGGDLTKLQGPLCAQAVAVAMTCAHLTYLTNNAPENQVHKHLKAETARPVHPARSKVFIQTQPTPTAKRTEFMCLHPCFRVHGDPSTLKRGVSSCRFGMEVF